MDRISFLFFHGPILWMCPTKFGHNTPITQMIGMPHSWIMIFAILLGTTPPTCQLIINQPGPSDSPCTPLPWQPGKGKTNHGANKGSSQLKLECMLSNWGVWIQSCFQLLG